MARDLVADRPVLIIDVTTEPIPRLEPARPVVTIGVAARPIEVDSELDVMLTDAPDPPAPWVACPEGASTRAERIAGAVQSSPEASIVLVQLLRIAASLPVPEALVAESLAYSVLQAGPVFRAWLAHRGASARPASPGPAVVLNRAGDELRIELNRPGVRNAFNTEVRDGLVAGLELLAADPSITRAHLGGRGPAFCSGGDLAEFGTAPDPATAHVVRTTRSAGLLMHQSRDRLTAHLHGACVGAGIELPAFAGDVEAAPDTRMSLPEVGMGLVPGAGGTVSIPRRVGRARAAYLALTGDVIDAATALRWGLVDRVT